jgi:hypothetical protein
MMPDWSSALQPAVGGLVAVETNGFLCPSRYASIRTFSEPTIFGGSVHYEIRLDSDYQLKALQSSYRSLLLQRGWTKFAIAQSPQRSEAMGHEAAADTPLFMISALW